MQQVQVSDDIAAQLNELAEYSHISVTELVEQLVKSYKAEMVKRNELKVFFNRQDLRSLRWLSLSKP